jgi:hydrogenase-4 membrane subunit HyfE
MVISGRESKRLIALMSSIAQSVSIIMVWFNLIGSGCDQTLFAKEIKSIMITYFLIGTLLIKAIKQTTKM